MKTVLLSLFIGLSCLARTPAAARDSAPQGFNRETVEITFDRHKGELYRLYRLALRDRPDLSGRIVFEIGIDGAGVPGRCIVKSSQLHAPDLENKLCERIRLFRFDPQIPATIIKEISFFPAK